MNTRLLLLLIIPLLSNCADEPNGKTEFSLDYATDGLEISLTGSATNSSNPVTELKVEWGDGSSPTAIGSGFDSIMETHKYGNEGIYNIISTAINNVGDTAVDLQAVTVSFKETSLAGVRPAMYKTDVDEYLFLTLNLHTYQEKDQLEKLNMVVDVIGEMDIDFIAFQECAQHKAAKVIEGDIKEDNMAYLITEGLQEKYSKSYDYIWDWSHYGWTVWEEGVAVLSKYPIIDQESRYVSSATSLNNIESRKVIYGACQLPDGGTVNVFSAHLHWRKTLTDQEQNNQIRNMQTMVNEKSTANSYSFIAGDFNGNPTSDVPWSEGYFTMIDNGNYVDSYLLANLDANNKPAQSKHHTVLGSFPGRIDYIFMKGNPDFEVVDSQIIFRPDVIGVVSDHYGVITKMKKLQ